MELEEVVRQVRAGLRAGRYKSEAAVSQGVVLPVFQALEWPVLDTSVVTPEFTVEGRRVDFALCHPADRPLVFLEVKRPGGAKGADRQLFEYAFHRGVPMAVLTDGNEWHFYLPAEQGDYDERRVHRLALVDRDVAASCLRLRRYLAYAAVRAGEALDAARSDYRDLARRRQAQEAIPRAWKELVSESDGLLIDLLAERAEDVCGCKPARDACAQFLTRLQPGGVRTPSGRRPASKTVAPAEPTVAHTHIAAPKSREPRRGRGPGSGLPEARERAVHDLGALGFEVRAVPMKSTWREVVRGGRKGYVVMPSKAKPERKGRRMYWFFGFSADDVREAQRSGRPVAFLVLCGPAPVRRFCLPVQGDIGTALVGTDADPNRTGKADLYETPEGEVVLTTRHGSATLDAVHEGYELLDAVWPPEG